MDTHSLDRIQWPRRRQLTPAGQQFYEESVVKFTNKLQKINDKINSLINEFNENEGDPVQLRDQIKDISRDYEKVSWDFSNFLIGQRTEDSEHETIAHRMVFQSVKGRVDDFIMKLETIIAKKPKSVISKGKASSSSSSEHKARLKLEKARLRQKYIDDECELAKKRTEIEFDIKRLETKREVEEAEIEVSVLEDYFEKEIDDASKEDIGLTKRRVENFVQEQRRIEQQKQIFGMWSKTEEIVPTPTTQQISTGWGPFPVVSVPLPFTTEDTTYSNMAPIISVRESRPLLMQFSDIDPSEHKIPSSAYRQTQPEGTALLHTRYTSTDSSQLPVTTATTMLNSTSSSTSHVTRPEVSSNSDHVQKNTVIADGVSVQQQSTGIDQKADILVCQELSRFLMKKDLLKSRLSKFDDRPEFFESWKRTFKDVMNELGLSPLEEIELAQIWLGPESRCYAQSIRAANENPKIACERLWERLDDRYGRPEVIEAALKRKLALFPKLTNRDNKKLFELADIISEISSVKNNPRLAMQFAYFDSSNGVNQVVQKLPYNIQEKWTVHADRYKSNNGYSYPPFTIFAEFLHNMARLKNDPSFMYEITTSQDTKTVSGKNAGSFGSQNVRVKKTDIPSQSEKQEVTQVCPLHGTSHSLNMCRAFRQKPIAERKEFIKGKGICFKCCGQRKHMAKECQKRIFCGICKLPSHPTALHIDKHNPQETSCKGNSVQTGNGGFVNALCDKQDLQQASDKDNPAPSGIGSNVNSSCTSVCGTPLNSSKSCAKTILVRVYHNDSPENSLCLYAVLDEQSNRSLAKSKLFDYFHMFGPDLPYSLKSCSGEFQHYGRRASGLVVESLDASCRLRLPDVIECNYIPDTRDEIPSPDVAKVYGHMHDIANEIHPVDPDAEILILIGRDLLPAHHVLDQRLGEGNAPYAQKLRLGWVVVGETCLGAQHRPDIISVYRTFTLMDGRPSLISPCENNIHLKEPDVFVKTKLDDTLGLSIEDRKFLHLMQSSVTKDIEGCWCMPLPFREGRQHLPDNREQALKRANTLTQVLQKNPRKREHVYEFMEKLFINNHAEKAPQLFKDEEHWYLPLFAVYHPKKPDKVRCVFDSSAKCKGLSLNDVLLTGPDLLNSLLGILIRFRQHSVAISADIEQMFYRFSVPPKDRNFLRFFWHANNDINQELVEYRMKRHVFGNKPSPAVATLGLHKTVENADSDVKNFVERNFYVDDGLISMDSAEEAVKLLSKTQNILKTAGNIRLHKIASNDLNVLRAFSKDDLAKDITEFDLELNETPPQRSLGIIWNIATDSFTFKVSKDVQPFTKRGVLSTINSLYDPLGFLAPVVVRGKIIMRDIMCAGLDWDDPLPPGYYSQWCEWRESLPSLEGVSIPRVYADIHNESVTRRELHVFSDASQKAIGAVVYLRIYDVNGNQHLSFVLGKAKVAPIHGHTIPRLELCAAVLATQLKDTVLRHLDFEIDNVTMYTDSKVILGYICNEQRRFYVYVGNRVDRIRQSTKANDWKYVSTEINPADIASRSISAESIHESLWLYGPEFLCQRRKENSSNSDAYPLIDPETDKEVKPLVVSLHSTWASGTSLSRRFEKYSEWSVLTKAISILQHVARCYNGTEKCVGWHRCKHSIDANSCKRAEHIVFKAVQRDNFFEEIRILMEGRQLPLGNPLASLSPYLDSDGILRVGGRLIKGKDHLHYIDVNPVIIPKHSHVALLLVRYHHNAVHHQGRRITEGRLRSAGLWIIGIKRLVSSVIHQCVVCRKLRGSFCSPKMADLPEDRLKPGPPFTFVGVDTFGPWNIIVRKTRGVHVNRKRWAILFTCLVIRAIHIEVIEEMSSSSFINALRRFVSIRGPVRQFRSDRGTNFIGAVNELGITSVLIEQEATQKFLMENECTWVFNPPHASHFGGVWERMIGVSRRILDGMLLRSSGKDLTHESLCTFLAEVCAIVNSRPLVSLTEDPNDPCVLSPNMILTQKVGNLPEGVPSLNTKDMYKAQWRHVQMLAKEFWKKWQRDYLCGLQTRQKWTTDQQNLKEGDIVLLKDCNTCRYLWPIAIVTRTFPASDGRVREVEIRLSREGKLIQYVRPVHELIPLLM